MLCWRYLYIPRCVSMGRNRREGGLPLPKRGSRIKRKCTTLHAIFLMRARGDIRSPSLTCRRLPFLSSSRHLELILQNFVKERDINSPFGAHVSINIGSFAVVYFDTMQHAVSVKPDSIRRCWELLGLPMIVHILSRMIIESRIRPIAYEFSIQILRKFSFDR